MLVVRVVPFLGLAIVPVSHKTRKHRNNIDSRFIESEAPPGVIVVLVVDGFKICLLALTGLGMSPIFVLILFWLRRGS